MIEMVVFVIGIYTLLFGSLRLPTNFSLQGWRARVAAFFSDSTFSNSIFLGRVVGSGLSAEKARSVFGLTELILVALWIGGAVLLAYLTRPPTSST